MPNTHLQVRLTGLRSSPFLYISNSQCKAPSNVTQSGTAASQSMQITSAFVRGKGQKLTQLPSSTQGCQEKHYPVTSLDTADSKCLCGSCMWSHQPCSRARVLMRRPTLADVRAPTEIGAYQLESISLWHPSTSARYAFDLRLEGLEIRFRPLGPRPRRLAYSTLPCCRLID
jgi:hypothetical protein